MEPIRQDRSAKWYVLASVAFLLVWQIGQLVGIARRAEVVLGLYGFVLHMIFGKGYSLIPSYFDRELAHWQAPVAQFPLTVLGTVALALATITNVDVPLKTLGALTWTVGVVVFVAEIAWTVRDNLSGRDTGTSSANVERETVDRVANAFMPIALFYLLWGSYETLAVATGLPNAVSYEPARTHVLAGGTGALLVFAVGFRLLPRFMVAHPPSILAGVVLPLGALGPLALALTLPGSRWTPLAAGMETLAILGFALAIWTLFRRSDRNRVGLYGVVVAAGFGVLAAFLGVWMVLAGLDAATPVVHLRVNLLGFVGLTIIGVAYQFYPPSIGTAPFAGDRAAIASIVAIALGLLAQIGALWIDAVAIRAGGIVLTLSGAVVYAYVIVAVFRGR